MQMKMISKDQLISLLQSCVEGSRSAVNLQHWMILNYEPSEVKIGESEPSHIQEAMNIVMNEYELASVEKFLDEGYKLAIDFISCKASEFESARSSFIRCGFRD